MAFLILIMLGATAGAIGTVLLRESGDAAVTWLARLRAALGFTTMADLQRQAAAEVLRRALVSVSVRYLPNDVLVLLHPDDHAKVGALASEFCRGVEALLQAAVDNGARDGGLPYRVVGAMGVRLKAEARIGKGTTGVVAAVTKDTQLIDADPGAGLLDLCVGDRRFPLPLNGDTLVGRSEHAGIRLRQPDVSREHAVLRCRGMQVTLRHVGESNRTRVNGEPTERAELGVGDRIELGATVATLELSARAAELIGRDTEPLAGEVPG